MDHFFGSKTVQILQQKCEKYLISNRSRDSNSLSRSWVSSFITINNYCNQNVRECDQFVLKVMRISILQTRIVTFLNFTTMISKCHDPFYDISRIGGTKTLTTTTHKINKQILRINLSFQNDFQLPSTSRYVSIGMYMPGFGLLASGLVLSALCLWFQMQPQQVEFFWIW